MVTRTRPFFKYLLLQLAGKYNYLQNCENLRNLTMEEYINNYNFNCNFNFTIICPFCIDISSCNYNVPKSGYPVINKYTMRL